MNIVNFLFQLLNSFDNPEDHQDIVDLIAHIHHNYVKNRTVIKIVLQSIQ